MSYSGDVVADSPLEYYRLGESAGTTLVDSSGNGRDGTYAGGYTLGATGLIAGDADTAVTISPFTTLGIAGPATTALNVSTLTIEALVSTSNSGIQIIACRHRGSVGTGWQFRINGSGQLEFLYVTANAGLGAAATSPGSYADGNKHHFAAVAVGGSSIGIYADGYLVGLVFNTNAIPSAGTTELLLGHHKAGASDSVGNVLNGTLDEVAIYSSALSLAKISSRAVAAGITAPAPYADPGGPLSTRALALTPAAYWRLGDTTGSAAADSSGNGRPGFYSGNLTKGQTRLAPAVGGDKCVDFAGGKVQAEYGAWMDTNFVSVFAIINTDSVTSTHCIVGHDLNGGNTDIAWRLDTNGNKVRFIIRRSGTTSTITSATSLVIGTTYRIGAYYDGVNARIFINGVQDASSALTGNLATPTSPITIGVLAAGSAFDGRIDEVMIFNYGLTNAQMISLDTAAMTQQLVLGKPSETSVARALSKTAVISKALGLAHEIETARALTRQAGAVTQGLGIVHEAETARALSLTATLTQTLGTPHEIDTPFPIDVVVGSNPPQTLTLGVAHETEAAFPLSLTASIAQVLGVAHEVDTPFALGLAAQLALTLGVVHEVDTPHPLLASSEVTVHLGVASEIETPRPLVLNARYVGALGIAHEVDSAFPLDLHAFVTRVLGMPHEVETPRSLDVDAVIERVLGLVHEIETPYGIESVRSVIRVRVWVDGQELPAELLGVTYDGRLIPVEVTAWVDGQERELEREAVAN